MSKILGTPNINPTVAQGVAANFSTWGAVRSLRAKQSMRCASLALSEPRDVTLYLGPIFGALTATYRVSAGVGGGSVALYATPDTGPAPVVADSYIEPIIIPRVGVALHVAAQEASIDVDAVSAGRYGAFASLGKPTRTVVNRHVTLPTAAPDADYPLVRIPPFAVDFRMVLSAGNAGATVTQYEPDGTPCSAALTALQCLEPVPLSPRAWWLGVVSAAAEPAAIAFGVVS